MRVPSCSLIISTYNRPDALQLCLQSVFMQSILPQEIIIADDGSGYPTKDLVDSIKRNTRVPIKHVWQEDEGYQLARIRNKAFMLAACEYLIQIDGDLVLHRHFVRDHLTIARPGTFISGARTMIDAELTKNLLSGAVRLQDIAKHSAHLDKQYNAVRLSLLRQFSYWFQRHRKNYRYVLGCNMAFWKKDLEKVNGYNELFTGWGKEDNELAVRLQNARIKLRFIKHGAIVYHLHHKVANLSFTEINERMLEKSIQNKITFVPTGMNRHQEIKKSQ